VLQTLAESLKETRDARLGRTSQDLIAPVMINPQHYSRVF
jgi:hypothetical protein